MTDQATTMPAMQPVRSSHIQAIGHEPGTKTLYVRFKDGVTWAYSGVDAGAFNQLRQSESVGSHFHRHVKGQFPGRKL